MVEAFREPEGNLGLRTLHGVRAVANVAAHVDAHVAANRARCAVSRVGCAKHDTASLDGIEALLLKSNKSTVNVQNQ